MKKSIFIITIISFHVSVFAQTQFTFSGKISGKANFAALFYTNGAGKPVKEICPLKNGLFSFKGDIKEPNIAFFYAFNSPTESRPNDDAPNSTSFFLEPGNIMANGSYGYLKELKIIGSKTQKEYNIIQSQIKEMDKELAPISNNFNKVSHEYTIAKKSNRNEKTLDSLERLVTVIHKQIEPFADRYEDIVRRFVVTHPNSYVSAYEMNVYTSSWPQDYVKKLYSSFSLKVRNSFYGQEIKKHITTTEENSVSKTAKNFTTVDINGKSISLSDFKGKYVLLDFWASWCVPCRESTPHIIKLYKKYSSKGLEVIAVASDDGQPAVWKRAVKKDKTGLWHNVLDGRVHLNMETQETDFSKSIGKQYAIESLPTKILIDKNGVIIGRYEENTASLDKKLAKIFGGSD